MLDILGDLALVGRPLLAHIIAVKPSHTANCELARQIVAQLRKPLVAARTFAPPPMPPATAAGASEAGELVEAVVNGGFVGGKQNIKNFSPPFSFLVGGPVAETHRKQNNRIK